jgi:hypothetical protein
MTICTAPGKVPAFLLTLCLGLMCAPFSAFAVTVDNNTGGTVYGNGTNADGTGSPPDSTATGYSVTVNSGGSASNVYGGSAFNASGVATAQDNRVTVNGGSVDVNVRGGNASADAFGATAQDNRVTVNSGSVRTVSGGYAYSNTSDATATGNSVIISGGSVDGPVYGGNVAINSGTGTATATGNSITISGSPTFAQTAKLYGGFSDNRGTGLSDAFAGNTLNIKTSDLKVPGLYNFEQLNFYLPATLKAKANGGAPMLIVTGTAQLSENADGSGNQATVNVGIEGASTPLKKGDQVVLIDADRLTGAPANTTVDGQAMPGVMQQGVTLEYDFAITRDGDTLLATVTGPDSGSHSGPVKQQTKALSEGWLAGVPLVNQTTDFLAGKGIPWAKAASRTATGGAGSGFGFFGGVSGGWNRYNTGSHIDMSSLSLIAGLAWGADVTPGRLTVGAFVEYGNGSYDTYNSFSNAASVHNDGDVEHIGGGVLGRFDANCGGYVEASARVGSVTNEYKGRDLRDGLGRNANYDADSTYYGLHAGLGYVWQFTDKASLDLYGKYFWTRQNGDSVHLSTGEPVKFKDVDSSRMRFGGRLAYAVSACVSPYVGAAWEHEFDGRARATTNGLGIAAPSLKGDTGIGELGLTLKLSTTPLSFDLGVQGYAGKREGVTGSLQARFEF